MKRSSRTLVRLFNLFPLLPLLPLLLASASCRVDRAEFEARVFSCNTAAPDPACGTDETGRDMSCFSARQIGATDFCTKTCDTPSSSTEDAVCLASSVALQTCKPSEDTATGRACSQSGLACYRTDLEHDEGVCTTLNPCDKNEACRDPVRAVCVTSFLAESIYPKASQDLKLDHLFCLQTGCKAQGTACSPGETCLQDVIAAAALPPDICVPNCDSNHRCPPNFLCYPKAATEPSPNVCIPGLLGFVCESNIDCMIGVCKPTDTGYNVCTIPCDDEAECAKFDGPQGKFVCVKNPAALSEPGQCQSPNFFRGTICNTTKDCIGRNPEEICSHVVPGSVQGVCLLPCSGEGKCPQRGGISHTCVPSPEAPVCFPGFFGYPCGGDDNCVGDLTCHPTFPTQPSVCTTGCAEDADCVGNRWVGDAGWCGKALGNPVCLPAHTLPDQSPCPSNLACASGKCTNRVCAP